MRRFLLLTLPAANAAFPAPVRAQKPLPPRDSKLTINDADYREFLDHIDAMLPQLEASLRKITPEKDDRISYSLGMLLTANRDLSLIELGKVQTYVARQHVNHTVSGELALAYSLSSLYGVMGDEDEKESANSLTLSDLRKYALALSDIRIRIENDSSAEYCASEGSVLHCGLRALMSGILG